eukprot:2630070-Rhodomonas_salina.1
MLVFCYPGTAISTPLNVFVMRVSVSLVPGYIVPGRNSYPGTAYPGTGRNSFLASFGRSWSRIRWKSLGNTVLLQSYHIRYMETRVPVPGNTGYRRIPGFAGPFCSPDPWVLKHPVPRYTCTWVPGYAHTFRFNAIATATVPVQMRHQEPEWEAWKRNRVQVERTCTDPGTTGTIVPKSVTVTVPVPLPGYGRNSYPGSVPGMIPPGYAVTSTVHVYPVSNARVPEYF